MHLALNLDTNAMIPQIMGREQGRVQENYDILIPACRTLVARKEVSRLHTGAVNVDLNIPRTPQSNFHCDQIQR